MTRNKHSKQFKIQVVKEALETWKTSIVARRYELNTNMVCRQVREYKSGKFGDIDVASVPDLDPKQLSNENDQLKKLLGAFSLSCQLSMSMIVALQTIIWD